MAKDNKLIWVALIVGILFATNIVKVSDIQGWLGGVTGPTVTTLPAGVGVDGCPSTMQTVIKTRSRNPLNSSLNYIAGTVYYVGSDNKQKASESTTSSAEGSWSTGATVTCGDTYRVMRVNDASYPASSHNIGQVKGYIQYADVTGTNSGPLVFWMGKSDYSNITHTNDVPEDWVFDTTTAAQTLGAAAGDTFSGYLKFKCNSTAAQFGSDDMIPYLCLDFDTAIYSKANGVIVSGLTEVPISQVAYCAANGYDKAYKLPKAIRSTDGEWQYSITIRNDLAAASNKDVKFLIVDQHYYFGIDGTVKSGTADDGLTAVGETDRYITFDDD